MKYITYYKNIELHYPKKYHQLIQYCRTNKVNFAALKYITSSNIPENVKMIILDDNKNHPQIFDLYQILININQNKFLLYMQEHEIYNLIKYCKLSQNSIKILDDYWEKILACQILNDNTITKFHHKISFSHLTFRQTLSEYILTKFQNILEWKCVSAYQTLDLKLINKLYRNLNMENILKYQNISDKLLEKFIYKIPPGTNMYRPSILCKKYKKILNQICETEKHGGHILGYPPPNVCENTSSHFIGYLPVSYLYKSYALPIHFQIGHTYERFCYYNQDQNYSIGFIIFTTNISSHRGERTLKVGILPQNIIYTNIDQHTMYCNKITILEEC